MKNVLNFNEYSINEEKGSEKSLSVAVADWVKKKKLTKEEIMKDLKSMKSGFIKFLNMYYPPIDEDIVDYKFKQLVNSVFGKKK